MARLRYRNPPLVEAVCEFRFEPGNAAHVEAVDAIQRALPHYRERRTVRGVEGQVDITGDSFAHAFRTVDRTQLLADDGRIVQVWPGALTVNHVPPYDTWESWRSEVHEVLDVYVQSLEPRALLRIGLTYLNRIELPGTETKLEEWFVVHPHIGGELGDRHGPFSMSLQFDDESGWGPDVVRLDFASSLQASPERSAFELHLHARPVDDPPAIEDAMAWLDRAHAVIDRLFHASLTPKLREYLGEEART